MSRKQMPELASTGRRYRDDTLRARLASPGIERFRSERRGGGIAVAALAVLAALVAIGMWMSLAR